MFPEGVAVVEGAKQGGFGDRGFQCFLDSTFERTDTVDWIVADFCPSIAPSERVRLERSPADVLIFQKIRESISNRWCAFLPPL